MTAATLNQIVLGAAERYRDHPIMRYKHDGHWHDIDFGTFRGRVRAVAAALRGQQLEPGARVAILSENRPEWAIADCACLAARFVDVPIYPTLTAQQTAYILRDAGAQLIFVSSAPHLDKVLSIRDQLPALTTVVLFDGTSAASGVIPFARFESSGAAAGHDEASWESDALAVTPDDLATLIYTSGTTGEPKGVMLSHGNIASNVMAALTAFDLDGTDDCLSFLPLCHIFERMAGYYCMIAGGAVINYATSIDAVADELLEVHPTVLMSVPRLYEKIYARVHETARAAGAFSQRVLTWARDVGDQQVRHRLAHQTIPWPLALQDRVADALVFAKLRQRTGGRIRFCVSGGAPLDPEICRFFLAAGIPLLEGYGLTETSPVIAVNTLDQIAPGTVGRPLPGVEVRIATDGEILARGPGIMKGYFHQPGATAEAIDHDGWFHTGDIGMLDGGGFLRITDRKKDLIKTSGGKYIAPQPIEALLRHNRFIANAVVLGDRHQFPIALLVPDFDALRSWLAAQQIPPGTPAEMVADPKVQEMLEDQARQSLRQLAQFEMPKKFLVLAHDFSAETGELTPTLKVRRNAVAERYRVQIAALYPPG